MQGRPFMQGLLDNKPLRNILLATSAVAVLGTLEIVRPFNDYLSLVPFPSGVRPIRALGATCARA